MLSGPHLFPRVATQSRCPDTPPSQRSPAPGRSPQSRRVYWGEETWDELGFRGWDLPWTHPHLAGEHKRLFFNPSGSPVLHHDVDSTACFHLPGRGHYGHLPRLPTHCCLLRCRAASGCDATPKSRGGRGRTSHCVWAPSAVSWYCYILIQQESEYPGPSQIWVRRALDFFGIQCSMDVMDLLTNELPVIAKLLSIYKRQRKWGKRLR